MRKIVPLFSILCLCATILSGRQGCPAEPAHPAAALSDEFVGPFPSWTDVKRDYGAVGDGRADDTAAIQKAFDVLRPADSKKKVLYFPAGVYRITATLNVDREAHSESQGISILGEDPATTTIRWDGPADGVMIHYSPWYSRMERLTLDGAGRAMTAIRHGKPFATALEYADMVIQNVGFGIEAGERDGIAETSVLRCVFRRCSKAGINIQNFNSLDWWIWYGLFEDCHIGVSSEYNKGGGHFHVYESLFRRSTESDITTMHASYFGIRNNTSVGSRAFFVAKRAQNWTDAENWGAQATLQGNTVLDPQDPEPIRIANAGNILLLDNVIRSPRSVRAGPVVRQVTPAGQADMVSIGNTFTVPAPREVKGRLVSLDDRVVPTERIQRAIPTLPGVPPNRHRRVFEVAAGAGAAEIQAAIDAAARLTGERPVVHLPPGDYKIDRTLTIPAGADLQLIGDGIINATNLNWTGAGAGPVLRLQGPSRATLREFTVHGGPDVTGIRLENCDQPGGRVFMEGSQVDSAKDAGLLVDGLEHADVSLHDFGHGSSKVGVRVVGGPDARQGKPVDGRVVIFSGASGNNELSYDIQDGGRLLARDIWYEGQFRGFLHLTGNGTFTLHGAMVAVGRYDGKEAIPGERGNPAIALDSFEGHLTVIGANISSVDPAAPANVAVSGDTPANLLLLGSVLAPGAFSNTDSHAHVLLLHNRSQDKTVGTTPLPDNGTPNPAFLRAMLAQTRSERPRLLTAIRQGLTDARFYRVFVQNVRVGIGLRVGGDGL